MKVNMKTKIIYSIRVVFAIIFALSLALKAVQFFEGETGTKLYKRVSEEIQNLAVTVCPLKYKSRIKQLHEVPRISDVIDINIQLSNGLKVNLKNETQLFEHFGLKMKDIWRDFLRNSNEFGLLGCARIKLPRFTSNNLVSLDFSTRITTGMAN